MITRKIFLSTLYLKDSSVINRYYDNMRILTVAISPYIIFRLKLSARAIQIFPTTTSHNAV